ncbi:hypothetical protein GCM10010398_23510 [Streptomyces fimbriatus]
MNGLEVSGACPVHDGSSAPAGWAGCSPGPWVRDPSGCPPAPRGVRASGDKAVEALHIALENLPRERGVDRPAPVPGVRGRKQRYGR